MIDSQFRQPCYWLGVKRGNSIMISRLFFGNGAQGRGSLSKAGQWVAGDGSLLNLLGFSGCDSQRFGSLVSPLVKIGGGS